MSDTDRAGVPRWLASSAAFTWRALVLLAGVALVGVAFFRLRVVMVPLVSALFLSTILVPPTRWLQRRGVPRLVAAWLVFLTASAVIAALVLVVLPAAKSEFVALGNEVQVGLARTQSWLVKGPLRLSPSQVGALLGKVSHAIAVNQAGLLRGALSGVSIAAEVAAGILLTVVFTFFFVLDGELIAAWIVSLASDQRRVMQLEELGRVLWRTVTGYVRGTALNGAINAISLSIALAILGVPLVLPIALITVVGSFVPLVGGVVSGLLAALVTLVAKGPLAALVIVGVTVLIHNMEGYLTGPLVLGKAVRLHPVAILIILAIGSVLGGIIGAFVAVPTAAMILAALSVLRRPALAISGGGTPGGASGSPGADSRKRQAARRRRRAIGLE